MILPWQWRTIGGGPPIYTSITQDETEVLQQLARGSTCVVEVGAAYGYSTIVLAQQCPLVISIDPHVQMNTLMQFWQNLQVYDVAHKVLVGLSKSELMLDKLVGNYFPGDVDLVFLDGDHTKEAVQRDIQLAGRLIRPTGVIACHDYHEDNCWGVTEAIDELLPQGHLVADTLWVYDRVEK